VIFMLEMNRPVVRRRDDAATMRSKRIRSTTENAVLSERGGECVVLELQGVLFFGNADQLASEIEKLNPDTKLVVLDFQHVTNVDASGEAALEQIAGRLKKGGKLLVLSGLEDIQLFRGGATVLAASPSFVDLDAALEHGEEHLIASVHSKESAAELSLEETDFGRTMNPDDLAILGRHMQPLVLAKGATLSRAGDASDRLWVITRGSVGIWMDMSDGRRRIASIGTGCVVGEMGLLNDLPRSADICADDDVTGYVLTAAAVQDILANQPHIAQAALVSIARQLAEGCGPRPKSCAPPSRGAAVQDTRLREPAASVAPLAPYCPDRRVCERMLGTRFSSWSSAVAFAERIASNRLAREYDEILLRHRPRPLTNLEPLSASAVVRIPLDRVDRVAVVAGHDAGVGPVAGRAADEKDGAGEVGRAVAGLPFGHEEAALLGSGGEQVA
jgi:CRP-like cAMP-binding protein/anti-anti-sigma regulatory factor